MIKLKCPECNHEWTTGYWRWVFKAPFHWLRYKGKKFGFRDFRKTKCPACGQKSWIASEKQ